MALEPVTPTEIKNAPNLIKIPDTLIVGKDGAMAREWIYFFNNIGRAIDQQLTANLPELSQRLIESAQDILRLDGDAESTNLELAYAINDIANNTASIANQAISIANINTAVNTQQGFIDALVTAVSTGEIQLNAFGGMLQSQQNAIDALELRITDLENAP